MDYQAIAEKIKQADAVLIGASNGLSITEGLHIFADNKAFEDLFGDFKRNYGITCLLHGMTAHWNRRNGASGAASSTITARNMKRRLS